MYRAYHDRHGDSGNGMRARSLGDSLQAQQVQHQQAQNSSLQRFHKRAEDARIEANKNENLRQARFLAVNNYSSVRRDGNGAVPGGVQDARRNREYQAVGRQGSPVGSSVLGSPRVDA